jgi:signal transduction histidine kinase
MWRRRSLRAWLLEVGLALLGLLLGVFFATESVAEGQAPPWYLEAIAAACAFFALVLFRRDHPVALTLVLIPFGIRFGMPMGATLVALFAVALHRRARITIGLTTLHAAAVISVYLIVLGPTRSYFEAVSFLILLDICVVAVAMLIRSHRLLVRSWADRARHAEEGQRLRIEQARLGERERIAREMHDVLAHRLSLLAVHAGALEVRREAPAPEREAAGVIRQSAYDALEDLRQVIGMLRDQQSEDRPQPTLRDVPALIEESREAGATVDLELTGRDDEVPVGVGRHAYRIVQEALTNARKHAPGAPVLVAVSGCAEEGLVVEVGNALVRGGTIPGAGAGLVGLRERVQLAGGRLEHGPTPAGRFMVRAWLPWAP